MVITFIRSYVLEVGLWLFVVIFDLDMGVYYNMDIGCICGVIVFVLFLFFIMEYKIYEEEVL